MTVRSVAIVCGRRISVCTPTKTRYPAPSHLTALKAVADVASTADNPAAAASACTRLPELEPGHRSQPDRAAVADAAIDDVQHGRAGDQSRASEAAAKAANVGQVRHGGQIIRQTGDIDRGIWRAVGQRANAACRTMRARTHIGRRPRSHPAVHHLSSNTYSAFSCCHDSSGRGSNTSATSTRWICSRWPSNTPFGNGMMCSAVPDVGTDRRVVQTELLGEFAAQRRLVRLARIEAAAGQRPSCAGGELEAHQQHAVDRGARTIARTASRMRSPSGPRRVRPSVIPPGCRSGRR